ncbi:MazG nucleotide pyrophosphohydrolase domain-containing protein [Archaeoglobus profundus]|uniref:MazG nucleotide pyrophosphohydrolase n=1 Tax=Archaeoglobus profundus (strain DSM 5631 / JCM 9629 / NBRC 100127 / Av18) TaxID=572546 RepID=D2RFM8_ARCPA|nr:MazG nucleotide pyrophosphohydrolase domain-containing protein [Archaeoglobus profundus]ADB57103.1 MazG nucleotide pyrophosphohydrolase [Archaeoglobus profundus DSM 5631]
MDLKEVRKAIKEKYYEIDARSGELFLLAVLFEEVGELAEAVRKRDVKAIEEELTDVLFMVLSLANYFNVDIESRLVEKYIKGDPSGRWDLPE